MTFSDLPTLNAILNSISALLLICGYRMIRARKIPQHRACMVGAFVTSTIFLCSYLLYHYTAGATRFQGAGIIRTIYFLILITHTILAAAVPFLAVTTLVFALKNSLDRHRRIARWTLPIWLYVSVTGVVIYLLLYHL